MRRENCLGDTRSEFRTKGGDLVFDSGSEGDDETQIEGATSDRARTEAPPTITNH